MCPYIETILLVAIVLLRTGGCAHNQAPERKPETSVPDKANLVGQHQFVSRFYCGNSTMAGWWGELIITGDREVITPGRTGENHIGSLRAENQPKNMFPEGKLFPH